MRKSCARLTADINLCSSSLRQFEVAGNKVRVQVSLKNMADFQALLVCSLQINFHVPLWIDDRGFTGGSQHVGCMGQTSQIKLLKIHQHSSQAVASRFVLLSS